MNDRGMNESGRPAQPESTDQSEAAAGAPRRKRRAVRIVAVTAVVALLLVAGVGVGYWLWFDRQLDDIPRIDAGLSAGKEVDQPGRPLNILLIGVESGDSPHTVAEGLAMPEWPGGFRSDTMMLLRLSADRRSAQAISLPRDTWVRFPDCAPYADLLDDCHAKLNAAFSYGGPKVMVKTIEALTGSHIDHLAAIDFAGFEQLTTDLGGVRVFVPETVTDSANDLTWKQGWTTVEGHRALSYVRMRYGLAGGDFDRIARQQNFLRAVIGKISSSVGADNPVTTTKVIGTITDQLVVDEGWTSKEIRQLGLSLRRLSPDSVEFYTVQATADRAGAQAILRVEQRQVRAAFRALDEGRITAYAEKHPKVVRKLGGTQQVS